MVVWLPFSFFLAKLRKKKYFVGHWVMLLGDVTGLKNGTKFVKDFVNWYQIMLLFGIQIPSYRAFSRSSVMFWSYIRSQMRSLNELCSVLATCTAWVSTVLNCWALSALNTRFSSSCGGMGLGTLDSCVSFSWENKRHVRRSWYNIVT